MFENTQKNSARQTSNGVNQHNHTTNQDKKMRKPNCTCGKECLGCTAEKLSVTCECKMEAKQYEYRLDDKLKHAEHEHKVDSPTTKEGELIYTCPMHPEVRQSEPGRCPGCGMELIAKRRGAETAKEHKTHDISKVSHKDHETAMTDPRIAKQM